MENTIWCKEFENIISKCSEAKGYMNKMWWNICEFELDCGLIRLDIMGKTQLNHLEDFDKIEVDGVVYEMEQILGD